MKTQELDNLEFPKTEELFGLRRSPKDHLCQGLRLGTGPATVWDNLAAIARLLDLLWKEGLLEQEDYQRLRRQVLEVMNQHHKS